MIRTSQDSAIVDLNRSHPKPLCFYGEIVSERDHAHNRTSQSQSQSQDQIQCLCLYQYR